MSAVIAAALLSACGGETEVSSSTVPTTTSTETTAPPTSAPPTTVPASTAPPTTAPPTTAPATTAPPTTEPPATTAPPTTAPAAPSPATAFATADDALVEIDAATGATVRVLEEYFSGEGVFRGELRLSPDRSTIWFSEGYEDGWFGCDTSIGSFGRIDAATGDIEVLGVGSFVEPSADGEMIVYLASSLCLPDPQQPEYWVLTPYDRIVVRSLATGEEREFVTDTAPADYSSPSIVQGAWFGPGGNLLVMVGDGRLFDIDIDGPSVIQDHPVALPEISESPVAATADALLALALGDEGAYDLFSIDPTSGEATLLASSGAYMAVGVSADDQIVVSSFEPITVEPGAAVTVVELPGNPFVYDIDW